MMGFAMRMKCCPACPFLDGTPVGFNSFLLFQAQHIHLFYFTKSLVTRHVGMPPLLCLAGIGIRLLYPAQLRTRGALQKMRHAGWIKAKETR
jgi:hypothetical protein